MDEHRSQHLRIRLNLLTNVAGRVTPFILARGWKLGTLYEVYPDDANLLGLNYNQGEGIFIRLRSAIDEYLSMPRIIDIMLHELAHVEHPNHGPEFFVLWEQLRREFEDNPGNGDHQDHSGIDVSVQLIIPDQTDANTIVCPS
ncbi:WLM domain-containing protein [Aspergillus affinis]|uniref:WLM domain-containing protein n=1 Tax=Aspergillus affinis TaxID=1070780 RepID=UPI0022FDE2A1|nr:WLM domain-containing protein [Aspergillus affinis]KAI9037220.1 WLM domain-containing protein [Aspergillus affinis]